MPTDLIHTPAYRLFHYYYKCYIPQYCLYNEAYLTHVGVPTTTDRTTDRQLANLPTLSQVTIVQMTEYFSNGATLQLENPKDSVPIYQTIMEHLQEWYAILQDPLDTRETPEEDLKQFDAFATDLYGIARGYLDHDHFGNRLFKGLATLEADGPIKRHKPNPEEVKVRMPRSHPSITESLTHLAAKKKRRWSN